MTEFLRVKEVVRGDIRVGGRLGHRGILVENNLFIDCVLVLVLLLLPPFLLPFLQLRNDPALETLIEPPDLIRKHRGSSHYHRVKPCQLVCIL